MGARGSLKLDVNPGAAFWPLNVYSRWTSHGKRMTAKLCVYSQAKRIADLDAR
jgi:hypothetical protein